MPYFVVAKDMKKNTITVAAKSCLKENVFSNGQVVVASEVNWISGAPKIGKRFSARLRYRAPLSLCVISEMKNTEAEVSFDVPQEAVTSGQSMVFYDKEECVGGGVIE